MVASKPTDRFVSPDVPAWPTPLTEEIHVLDGVFADPDAYRERALRGHFGDVSDRTVVFHGINTAPGPELPAFIESLFPKLTSQLTFFRQSPFGQKEPHVIHSDLSMGQWSAIYYMTPDPAPGDGTAFWERKADGARALAAPTTADYIKDALTWGDLRLWAPWYVVPAVYNRLLMFDSRLFHSRARENYGQGDDARLIQVVFGEFRS
jgi:hypothetical protein